MDSGDFQILFLGFFALGILLEFWLNALNRKEVKKNSKLPANLSGLAEKMDPETYLKSRSYTLASLSFDTTSLVFSSTLTLGILFSGILPWLDEFLVKTLGIGLHRNVAFIILVTAIPSLLRLPLAIYSTFHIEGRYGFNTMTWALFWADLIKQWLMSLALGIPLLYAIFFFMENAGQTWWLWVFGLMLFFQITMIIVYPIFIAPLFNRFQPIPDGDLKTQIMSLAKRLGFPAAEVFIMDGSRRSTHSNAYFTGLGKWRRIVLYDTLVGQMESKELVGILAHEIGHYRLKHIYKQMGVQVLTLGLLLFLASRALEWAPLYEAFGFKKDMAGPAIGLFLFITAFSSLSILFSPFQNLASRKHEYEADAYAAKSTGDAQSLQSALIKLSQKNLSNLTPHPWYSRFHYSHPTLLERLRALQPG